MSLMRERSEFVGSNVYFSILLKNCQLFRDMLGENEKGYFDDTDFFDEDFGPIYDTNLEEETEEEKIKEDVDVYSSPIYDTDWEGEFIERINYVAGDEIIGKIMEEIDFVTNKIVEEKVEKP